MRLIEVRKYRFAAVAIGASRCGHNYLLLKNLMYFGAYNNSPRLDKVVGGLLRITLLT